MTIRTVVRRAAVTTVVAVAGIAGTAGVAAAGNAGSGSCGSSGGTLWCGNTYNAAIFRDPDFGSPDKPTPVVDRLKTTYSWFSCWTTGDKHSGGNRTWYRTVGDNNGRTGWVPASSVFTYAGYDKDKTKPGLERC